MLCWFLPYNNKNQPQLYLLPLELPSPPHSQVITECQGNDREKGIKILPLDGRSVSHIVRRACGRGEVVMAIFRNSLPHRGSKLHLDMVMCLIIPVFEDFQGLIILLVLLHGSCVPGYL